jgi:hypothetical protein
MRLLLRIKYACDPPMIVEANLDHEFLERVSKLVLICDKIRRTMNGPATVTIDNSRGEYVLLESEAVVQGVMAKAGVENWQAVQYVVIPEGLLLGRWGAVWLWQECEARRSLIKTVSGFRELMGQASMFR